jgi:hypothetical protein
MRVLFALGVLLLGLSVASPAGADVRLDSITSPVHPGGTVTLVARAVTAGLCSMRVHFGSRAPIAGVGTTRRPLFGVLHWTWRMPARATRGRWSVDVSCAAVGSLHTSLVVK